MITKLPQSTRQEMLDKTGNKLLSLPETLRSTMTDTYKSDSMIYSFFLFAQQPFTSINSFWYFSPWMLYHSVLFCETSTVTCKFDSFSFICVCLFTVITMNNFNKPLNIESSFDKGCYKMANGSNGTQCCHLVRNPGNITLVARWQPNWRSYMTAP